MRNPNQKLIYLLWAVIGVLVVGSAAIIVMLVHKADDLSNTNYELTGDNSSLREQLRQAKASPTPSPTATPDYSASPTATPKSSSNR